MKKLFCFGVIGALVLSLCGCSSNDKYEELERRVSVLEERLAESANLETQTEDSVTSEVTIDVSTTSSEELEMCVYDLSNMSASEIVDLIPYYVENRPKQDDSYDDVYSKLKVQPLSYFHGDFSIGILYCSYDYSDVVGDYLLEISYGNAKPAMNGITIDVPNEAIKTMITFCVQDYSRAEEVFNLLGEYFSNSSYIHDVTIERDSGTVWCISYTVSLEHHEQSGSTRMQKYDNGYIFWVDIP
ncbi:MAG: hypothetical protein K5875_10650 [Saccharofermentans sp.]|nr:hypothetical protein [Saccharofermentans sp.]